MILRAIRTAAAAVIAMEHLSVVNITYLTFFIQTDHFLVHKAKLCQDGIREI